MRILLATFFFIYILFKFGVWFYIEHPDSAWTRFFFRVYFLSLIWNVWFHMRRYNINEDL